MYADANEDKIVNGAGGVDRPGEPAWVGQCWGNLTEEDQIREIKKGALWLYMKNVGLYKCPRGYRGETVTYSIVDSMNGFPQPNNVQGRTGTEGLIVKIRTQIHQPSERIVFVDEGFMTPDSYAVYYVIEAWWDDPMVRHSNGATFALADGHSDYIKWKGMDTVKWGKNSDRSHSSSKWEPQTPDGKRDLHIVQRGVWGRLGYESSVTP
jgi:prepilin-type processing-associated H-X9-DG protein